MGSYSSLARLQQATTLLLLVCSLAWLGWYWQQSPFFALAGFAVISMGYSLGLALEFLALRVFGKGDLTPQPTWTELVGAWLAETALSVRVFAWRQPFRWRAIPDQLEVSSGGTPRRGAVFIHGFVCNRGFWTPWLKHLRASGHPFVAVNLEPVFGSIDDYIATIDDAVRRMTKASGLPPVLVCHSMGGLAARAWLRATLAGERVHHVITIGTPHRGTWLGRFSRMKNGTQMRTDSKWLLELDKQSAPSWPRKFTCWYSNCDNIVFPASSATMRGADNRLVRGVAHVQLAFDRRVMAESLAKILC